MSTLRKTFAANVRARRLALGMTQARLAALAEISRPDLARIEAGRVSPPLDWVAQIAEALQVEPDELLAAPQPPFPGKSFWLSPVAFAFRSTGSRLRINHR